MISRRRIKEAYATGRGSLLLRARWEKETLARGQWRIVVTELPHGVSVKQVMEEIEALANPKSGSRKEVSQEQRRMKQFILDQVESVRDESDRKSKLRLVIEPRSSRQDENEPGGHVDTALETRYPVNLTWLGLDGLPETKGIVDILREASVRTVRRRTEFRLAKCEARLHIVEGAGRPSPRSTTSSSSSARARTRPRRRKVPREVQVQPRSMEDIVNLRLGQLTSSTASR